MSKPTEQQLSELSQAVTEMVDFASSELHGTEREGGDWRRFLLRAYSCGMKSQGQEWLFEGEPCMEGVAKLGAELGIYQEEGKVGVDRRSGRLLMALANSMDIEL